MTDLFLHPDARLLELRWGYLMSVFRITLRDYRRVIAKRTRIDSHETILVQTVSDLLDLEVELFRMGKSSPAEAFTGDQRTLWTEATALVKERRLWRVPHDHLPNEEVRYALEMRKADLEHFRGVLCAVWPQPVDDGPAVPLPEDERPAGEGKHPPVATDAVFHTSSAAVARRS